MYQFPGMVQGYNPTPYSYTNPLQQYQPAQNVIRVNGENGARALNLPPRSSALALDEGAPIVWLITSDDAGYRTVKPYSITEYRPEPVIDINSLADRITRLEDRLNESYPECAQSVEPGRAKRSTNVSTLPNRSKSNRVPQPDYSEEPGPSADRE